MKRSQWWAIFVSHSLVFAALGCSLYWNIRQAKEREVDIEIAYVIGFEQGGEFLKARLKHELEEFGQPEPSPTPAADNNL